MPAPIRPAPKLHVSRRVHVHSDVLDLLLGSHLRSQHCHLTIPPTEVEKERAALAVRAATAARAPTVANIDMGNEGNQPGAALVAHRPRLYRSRPKLYELARAHYLRQGNVPLPPVLLVARYRVREENLASLLYISRH